MLPFYQKWHFDILIICCFDYLHYLFLYIIKTELGDLYLKKQKAKKQKKQLYFA